VPRPDGKLAALSAADGSELWSTDLGAPVVSAPAPAGDYLVVATFDGTVHALVPATQVMPGDVEACGDVPEPPPPGDAGCCGTSGKRDARSAIVLAVLVCGLVGGRRRRRGQLKCR
jgi:hypothetical protein